MDRVFNNADSLAMAFDDAWHNEMKNKNFLDLSAQERKRYLFENCIKEHPFLTNSPEEASQVADFRIRLLGLDQ